MLRCADIMKLDFTCAEGWQSRIDYLNQRMRVRTLVRWLVLTIQPERCGAPETIKNESARVSSPAPAGPERQALIERFVI
jgi:hypothetical protein